MHMDAVIALLLQVKLRLRLPSKNKHPSIRKKWLANIKRRGQLPKEEHFIICSQHFEEDYFKRDLKVSIDCIYTIR